MSAARRLGEAFRHLSSMLSSREVRSEDEVRHLRSGGPIDKRAAAIRAEALKAEKGLR